NDLPKSILTEILQGGADKAAEAGIPIVGGHSIDDKEPKYGLVVTGEVDEENMWTNSGAQPGDILILTKPLGTGIIATAIKKEAAPEESVFAAIESMSTLNKDAVQALQGLEIHAVTDVTGYGLLGHLQEMCQASAVSGRIDFQNLEFLPGVQNLAEAGMIAGGTRRNLEYIKDYTEFDPQLTEVDLFLAADAQTSGGLLISMPQEDSEKFIAVFGPAAYQVGKIITRRESLVFLNN
ncbi:MAG: selenide, water dikinase SelD, partial [Candidatus Neomarinimicrobiota bacterium]|nr:selenide, water dikinase SelD [Candidatus Neomarinimicrobiota bacterium]